MRSTNIMVFLMLLNASAVLVGAIGMTDIGYVPEIGGDDRIDQANELGKNVESDRSALDEFVGGIISAADTLRKMFGIVVAGPAMLINLGAPKAIVAFFAAPLYALVGIDILQVISGRSLT